MGIETLALFAAAMFTLAIIPGPGVLVTVARTISSGISHGMVTIMGIVIGDLLFLLLAIYGLSKIAESLGVLFTVIKYAGAFYLIWLGIDLWRTAKKSTPLANHEAPDNLQSTPGYGPDLATGLIITLSNPKVILFYLSFLPAFVDIRSLSGIDVLLIAAVVSLVLGSVMLFYAVSAAKARSLFTNRRTQAVSRRIAGSLIITTGGVLLVKS